MALANIRQKLEDIAQRSRNVQWLNVDVEHPEHESNYFIIHAVGDCLDSGRSPMRIKDDSYLLCREIDKNDFMVHWQDYCGELLTLIPIEDNPAMSMTLIKQFTQLRASWFLSLKMFNPEKEFSIPIDWLHAIAVVEKDVTELVNRKNNPS